MKPCEAREIAAKAWCDNSTSHLDMIPELAEAFAKILVEEVGKASPASAPEGWKDFLQDLTQKISEAMDNTPDSFHREMVRLAHRAHKLLAAAPTPPVSEDRKDAERFRDGWTHSCNALCMEIALWIERCPHCGMPAPKAPAMQEDKR